MEPDNIDIDKNPLNIILRIIQNIEAPLSTLIEESCRINTFKYVNASSIDSESKEIIFSNSQEIKQLIDKVLDHIKTNQILEKEPLIFQIYKSNEQVQSMCKNKVEPAKISKQDTGWLLGLEKEVYKNIERREIHLADLSYNLAVSKRQLNRKIQNLLYLTPNKYIRVLKLHRAKELIDDFLYDTISEISYSVGYYDTHYFSKLFTHQYGVTPKELLDAKRY